MFVCAIALFLSLAKHAKSIAESDSFDIPVEQIKTSNRQEVTAQSYQIYWQKAGVLLQSAQPPCADAAVFSVLPATLQ